jgi:hypothetical protein
MGNENEYASFRPLAQPIAVATEWPFSQPLEFCTATAVASASKRGQSVVKV